MTAHPWRIAIAIMLCSFCGDRSASLTHAQQATAQSATPAPRSARYSDDVVAKADQILDGAGIRRSGKTLVATPVSDLNRKLSNLTKSRRAIKQLADERKRTEEQLTRTRQQFQLLDAQNGQLNLRLVGPLPAKANNQLVGMINANNVRLRQLDTQRDQLREKLAADRKAVNQAEADYAESALAIRRELSQLQSALEPALQDPQLQIALKVLHANFQTPAELDIAVLLGATDRRMKQIEQEIFSEAISLEVTPSGSLYVDVMVGDSRTPMVLDSGASLVCLPAETAAQLGVTVPPDAPRMELVLADGRSIQARGVVLPKVRIGQFEAENIEAAVLDPAAIRAEPLLGMSFLGNFRFEIDAASRTLKMLRVGEEE